MTTVEEKPVLDISQTNIALLGSDLEKKCKLDAASTEEEWKKAGKEPGIQVWRIENYKVVPVTTDIGTFYDGDSYIILNSFKVSGDETLKHEIITFLGSFTSPDEAACASYRATELDDFLGGLPTQYRECQASESEKFLSLFPNYNIKNGGVESGLRKVVPVRYRPRLLTVGGGGRKTLGVQEIPLTTRCMTQSDSYVLDTGLTIYQLNGAKSTAFEKDKASQIANSLKTDRNGKPTISVCTFSDAPEEVWKLITGGKDSISLYGGEQVRSREYVLSKLSDESGELKFEQVARGKKIDRSLFDSKDTYIFDVGYQVFYWIGKNSSKQEKKQAFTFATNYLQSSGLPPYTPIVKVYELGSCASFDICFSN